ncbi:aldo/keto reductase [Hyphobacterium sp. HN65]|uniref:Aldo/keto reductase n=1 Tax=Hyphobacterium lacteum TaxID=3116575 RepID=A0ABU7LQH7_9PROT|nr:aldo/keto reductase [Hyphobacterium sp. HN65]MEE2526162.1 aldo/keto reductase [Hyphobacterium sp. HN65]
MTLDLSRISPLGFGVSGPHKNWATSRERTQSLVQEAVELGINLFDTAPKYGNGEAESRLGESVAQLDRSQIFLVSKAGILDESNRRDFSPAGIERSVEASLVRLQTDYLDALLLQGAARHELTDDLFEALDRLKTAGKFRHAGASGRGEELDNVISDPRLDIIMAPHYYGQWDTQRERLVTARAAGKTILGIEASSGSPSGLPSPFSRAGLWYFARYAQHLAQDFRLRAAGHDIPPRRGDKPIVEALQWAIDDPLSDCLMIQTTRAGHLRTNAALAGLDGRPGTT